jgi:hypothetical protein
MSRARAGIIPSAVVFALELAGCASLEHFAVYEVQKVEVSFVVQLTDQLDPAAKEAKLQALTHFANPTRKVHGGTATGIHQPDQHLTWYALEQGHAELVRKVRFGNQFGQHTVDVGDPRFLLVPAQKTSHAGSAFPESLDHYKCYEIVQVNTAPPLPVVILGDQFGSQSGVQVGKPRFFCPPVKKERQGEPPQEIKNKVDHLAVYDLPPLARAVSIKVKDQFGDRPLDVVQKVMLVVPTKKQEVVAHQN